MFNQPNLGRFVPPEEVILENVAMENTVQNLCGEWLWQNFQHIGGKAGETRDIREIAEAFAVKDEALFRESLDCLREDHAVLEGDKIRFVKPVPVGYAIDHLLNNEPVKEFAENFAVFLDFVIAGFDKTLLGVIGSNFDPSAWDKVLGGSFYTNDRRRALEYARVDKFFETNEPPVRILDFGCGTGFSAVQIQDYFDAIGIDCEIFCYDPQPGMVEAAQKRHPTLIPYVLGDPENTIRFDAVFASYCLHYLSADKQRPTMALIDSLLASPGMLLGCGLFSDYTPYVKTILKILGAAGGAAGAPSGAEFVDWFKGTSFKTVRVDPQDRVFCVEK